jgi:hypothetical protein
VHQPAGSGLLLGLAALGLFSRSPQIDDFAHVKLGGNQISGLAILALWVWKSYADAVTLDHSVIGTRNHALSSTIGSVAIPAESGKTRLIDMKKSAR